MEPSPNSDPSYSSKDNVSMTVVCILRAENAENVLEPEDGDGGDDGRKAGMLEEEQKNVLISVLFL